MGEWRYSSNFLDLGTRWRSVVSITPRPLYTQGNRPKYPLDRRLSVPQNRRTHVRDSNSENGIFSVTDFTITLYLTYNRGNFYPSPVRDNSTHRQECFSHVLHIWVTSSCMSVHCDLMTCTHIFHCNPGYQYFVSDCPSFLATSYLI
jgi:hypothetical protein